ncbi:MAG: hypothetical protein ACI841_004088 [Planctomycetota bacterium]|jgi:hypothetical protein
MLCFWGGGLIVLQSYVASHEMLARWTPELGLVLLVALAGARHFGGLFVASYWLALCRLAFSIELPSAVLAGFLAVAILLRSVCTVLEVRGFFSRAWAAGLACWIFLHWLSFVHVWHEGVSLWSVSALDGSDAIATCAVSTAVCSVFMAPVLRRLPGLSPLMDSDMGGLVPVHYAAPLLRSST